jgi:hypothetical protein
LIRSHLLAQRHEQAGAVRESGTSGDPALAHGAEPTGVGMGSMLLPVSSEDSAGYRIPDS